MKKYKTWEAIKMLSKNPKLKFQYKDYILFIDDTFIICTLGIDKLLQPFTIDYEWKLIQEEVEFLDAVKAHSSGETIYCICEEDKYFYTPKSTDENEGLEDSYGNPLSPKEILEGHWFIQEDKECEN